MTIEKTITFKVGDKNLLVADLELELRKRFETLDAFRQRQADAAIELEMATMAVSVTVAQLQQALKAKLAKTEAVKTDNG